MVIYLAIGHHRVALSLGDLLLGHRRDRHRALGRHHRVHADGAHSAHHAHAGADVVRVVYSMFHTIVILGATLLFFNITLSNANLITPFVVLLAGSFSFIGFSIVGSVLPLLFPERGSQMTHVIIALLLLISGVLLSVSVLPQWMQTLSLISPATYVLDGVRAGLLEGATVQMVWPQIWPLLIIGAVTLPLGLKIFDWAERYAKRTGKLHRNG